MKKYLSVYKTLMYLNWLALVAYRSNLMASFLSSVVWGIFTLVSAVLLTAKTSSVFGWSRNEIILLTALYSVFIGVFHAFISRNMDRLGDLIYLGKLDFLLLKPLDDQFSSTLWVVNYMSVLRIVFGSIVSLYLMHLMHITVSFLDIVLFCLFSFAGLCVLYSIWLIVMSIVIWFPRLSNILDLLYNLSGIARYPQEMYKQLGTVLFVLLIPLTIILTTPVTVFLGRFNWAQGLQLIMLAGTLLVMSRGIWKFALRSYASASS